MTENLHRHFTNTQYSIVYVIFFYIAYSVNITVHCFSLEKMYDTTKGGVIPF